MPTRTPRFLGAIAAAAAVVLTLAGCASAGTDAATDSKSDSGIAAGELGSKERPVKLGVVGSGEEYWTTYKQVVADAGIALDLVDFTDYNQPNPALSAGELDINQFQHNIFLAGYNVAAGDDLQPIGATAIYPLGLYSQKVKSVEEIKKGDTVAVPNDETNQARGLLVLQSAGLIKLKDGGSTTSTLADVEDSSKVKVTAVDAALTVGSLPDVAAAIVNNDYLADAGLTAEDAIAQDDPSDPKAFPYINIFVTKKADVDNPVLNKLVELYQGSKEVLDGVKKASGGTAVLVTTPAVELQSSLKDVEADVKAAKK